MSGQFVGVVAAGLLGISVAGPAYAEATVEEHISLIVEGAFPGRQRRRPLHLRLKRIDGRWASRVWGRGFNRHPDNRGRIVKVKDRGSRSRLWIDIMIESSPWQTGGPATYALDVRRNGNAFEGKWTGKFRLTEHTGKVSGTAVSAPPRPDGFVPPRPGEHPRLLIRKHDIPALRKKAETPWGRNMLKRLEGGQVGWALLYVLTGDQDHATKAREAIIENFKRWVFPGGEGVHDPGVVAVEAAVAFDLIYDACSPEFRTMMNARFEEWLPHLFWGSSARGFNPHDNSNWAGQYRSGAGLCALVLWGERGTYPSRPWRHPSHSYDFSWFGEAGLRYAEPPDVEAPSGFTPGQGVPVMNLGTNSTLSSEWLVAGPFPTVAGVDPLASIGREAGARPELGTRVVFRGHGNSTVTCTFELLDRKHLRSTRRGDDTVTGVDVRAAVGENPGTADKTAYLYTVIENDTPGLMRISSTARGQFGGCLFLAGRRFADGDYMRLGKGRFPLLARIPFFSTARDYGPPFIVELARIDKADEKELLALYREEHRIRAGDWEAGRVAYERSGGLNPHAEDWIEIARHHLERYADSLGSHGWNMEGEAYTQHTLRVLLPFAHAYRNLTGRAMTARNDLFMTFPLYVAKTIFGRDHARMQGYGAGGGPLGVDNWARGFGLVPEKYKRACLWTWNRTLRVAEQGKLTTIYPTVEEIDPMSAAFMFVNYPLDMTEQNPAEVLPRVTVDEERGGYVFRNRWRDADDFVVSFFVDENCPGGSWSFPEGGSFRIAGLGEEWAVRGAGLGNGGSGRNLPHVRLLQNLLQVSDKRPEGRLTCGHSTYFDRHPDGSGTVTADLSPVYAAWGDISGTRSFAVDYSERSGAPCLVVVADRVSGTKGGNDWQFCADYVNTVDVTNNTFTVTAESGATLRGTVLLPRSPRISVSEHKKLRHEVAFHGGHWHGLFGRRVVHVQGGEKFIVIMTVQKDAAPLVEEKDSASRETFSAAAGERIIRFDGKKITFHAAPCGWRKDGSGVIAAARPPLRWFAKRNLLWTCDLPGPGTSSPVISRDRVYVTCAPAALVCVDAGSGRVAWRMSARSEAGSPAGVDPTPLAFRDRVVAAFGTGELLCADRDGKRLWDAAVAPAPHGLSSPASAREGGVVVVQGEKLVALKSGDGGEIWNVSLPDRKPYGTPVIVDAGEEELVVTAWGAVVRASDGKVLATELPRLVDASPVVVEGVAYFCGNSPKTGRPHAAAVRLPPSFAARARPTLVWENAKPCAAPFEGSPLVFGGRIYALTRSGELVVLDCGSGKGVYTRPLLGADERKDTSRCGDLAYAGGHLYIPNLGALRRTCIVAPGPEFRKVWQYAVADGVGGPAFAGRRQVVRGGAKLFCIGGTTPVQPPRPPAAVKIPPSGDVRDRAGVPAGPIVHGVIPARWIVAGPFAGRDLDTDHLADVGGRQKAVPAAGDSVRYGETAVSFRPVEDKHTWSHQKFTGGVKSIDVRAALNGRFDSTAYFFTVIEIDEPRYLRLKFLSPFDRWNPPERLQVQAWLAGKGLAVDKLIAVDKGRYPLMVQVSMGRCEHSGRIWMAPRFLDVTSNYLRQKRTYDEASAWWPEYQAGLDSLFVLGKPAGRAGAEDRKKQETPWPCRVAGWVAPEPGEHPRLLFRKHEIPVLRKRAQTPEGKAIITRLRKLLNGSDGESMPQWYNPVRGKVSRDGSGGGAHAPEGAYTISHVAGFGFLYVLTGEKKYADLGRRCMDKAFAEYRDRDRRYSFKHPFGALRAGPSLGWAALGYDLCYNGWDEAYRKKVAHALAAYSEGPNMSLAELVRGSRHFPTSNHWGMQVGGGALAVLAVMNDPGVDMKEIGALLKESRKAMIRNLTEGFGDHGWYPEGDGTGVMSSHIAFLPALQAWRVAGGLDFCTPRPNARWTVLKFVLLTIPRGGEPDFPKRGLYGGNVWNRRGISGPGTFCEGFGIVTDIEKTALLWLYNRVSWKLDKLEDTPCETAGPYPHRAILAFVNWPFDMQERNPIDSIPRAVGDRKWDFYAFRNRWKNENDILVSVQTRDTLGDYTGKPKKGAPTDGSIWVWGLGKKTKWGRMKTERITHFQAAADGSGILTGSDGTCLAVDFSKASGAEAMLVMSGPGAPRGNVVTAGGNTFSFTFVTTRTEPVPRVEGDKIVIGRQTVSMKGGNIVLGKMAGPWTGPKKVTLARKPTRPITPEERRQRLLQILPKWDAKLLARLRKELQAGRKPSFTLSDQTAHVLSVDRNGTMKLYAKRASGAKLFSYSFAKLQLKEKKNLAVAVATSRDEDDYALAAFYLWAADDIPQAKLYLKQAGSKAKEILDVFTGHQ